MFFTGEPLSAKEFADAGAAIFVCGSDQFLAEAKRLAARIASLSPTAVRVGKRILDRVERMDLRKGYEFEQAASVRLSGHPDFKEALTAFRERRESRYQPLARPSRWY